MARGGAVDIPGNDPGQVISSYSTYTHVQSAYGAPTGAVRGAADGRRNEFAARTPPGWAIAMRKKIVYGTQ